MDFPARVAAYQARVHDAMDRWLPSPELPPARLHDAMRYAVLGSGKRVRPLLVYATGEALGVPVERLDPVAAAVEMIHAYSLIHDDLPAMDDDDLRRGRPTCHRAFDEATAILAGDALQALALEIIASDPALAPVGERRIAMVALLAHASGSRGMAGGQALDLAAEGQRLTLDDLHAVHALKTGALISASVLLAAHAADALDGPRRAALERFGASIGVAFQIRDDILDVEGDTAVLGKRQGSDQKLDKSTFPALMGLDGAKARVDAVKADAIAAIAPLGAGAEPLRWLAGYIVDRNH